MYRIYQGGHVGKLFLVVGMGWVGLGVAYGSFVSTDARDLGRLASAFER